MYPVGTLGDVHPAIRYDNSVLYRLLRQILAAECTISVVLDLNVNLLT